MVFFKKKESEKYKGRGCLTRVKSLEKKNLVKISRHDGTTTVTCDVEFGGFNDLLKHEQCLFFLLLFHSLSSLFQEAILKSILLDMD